MIHARAPDQSANGIGAAVPWWAWLAPALLVPLAIGGPNSALAGYAIGVLAIGMRLLWRPGEPPILLFIFLFQWMQAATGALYGNAIGVPLSDLATYPGRHEFASGLMLTGVLVLAIAIRAAAGKPSLNLHARMKALVAARPFGFWVGVYTATWVFSAACEAIAPMVGGLQLPFLTMSKVKWAGFVLLTFAAFAGPTSSARKTWALIFGAEFVLSVGGFFASFKEVFFFALFGLVAVNVRLRPRVLIPGALLAVAMVGLGLVWTAIKGEYRAFVNAGSGQQVVLVDFNARVGKLVHLLGKLDRAELQDATDDFFIRLMYFSFFGAAAVNVPSSTPHSDGEIWGEAIGRPFMPRVLFPEKRAINDSDLTNQYTGLGVATADQGTSISLGYMAEAYIDFGPVLMFLAIAGLGLGLGVFYRWLLGQSGPMVVVGAALAPFALMPAHLAETSILKMVPSLILNALACMVVIKLLAPVALGRLARVPSKVRRR